VLPRRRLNLESLQASVRKLFEAVERHDSLREEDAENIRKDGENIRALAGAARDAVALRISAKPSAPPGHRGL
jgi:hypothetical protein